MRRARPRRISPPRSRPRPGARSRSPTPMPKCCCSASRWLDKLTLFQGEPSMATEPRSEEHTSELQSLMRTSYAVFCLKKNKQNTILCSTDGRTTNLTEQKVTYNQSNE